MVGIRAGGAYFRARVETYRPVPDRSVDSRFDARARANFEEYREGLATLQGRLEWRTRPATPR